MLNEKKRFPVAFILMVFLSSCATILNKPVQKVFITTDRNLKLISIDTTVVTDSLHSSNHSVQRSNRSLVIRVQTDSIEKSLRLQPTKSFAYWFNIPENYGIGMLIDKNSNKRYGYPVRNYLSLKDTTIHISRFAPVEKGAINLCLAPTLINSYDVKAAGKKYYTGGVFGMEAGLEYFFRSNQYLSFHAGAATSVFGEYIGAGSYEIANATFASIRRNYIIGSFDLGYGVNFSQLTWKRIYNDSAKKSELVKNPGAGLSLSAQYRLGNYFRLGFLYQPVLFNLNSKPSTGYQHFLSFNFVWKIPMKFSASKI